MAGVAGRSGNKKANIWFNAIQRAIKRREESDPQALERLADVLLNKASEGDMAAIKELGDRLDGKAVQATTISGPDGEAIPVGMKVSFVDGSGNSGT
jgi:hypothetical protein